MRSLTDKWLPGIVILASASTPEPELGTGAVVPHEEETQLTTVLNPQLGRIGLSHWCAYNLFRLAQLHSVQILSAYEPRTY